MRELKTILLVALAIGLGGTAIQIALVKRQNAREQTQIAAQRNAVRNAAMQQQQAPEVTAPLFAPVVPVIPEPLSPAETAKSSESKPVGPSVKAAPQTATGPQPTSMRPGSQPGQTAQSKKEFQDPLAREALALVGDDPAAEQYWLEAINDPSLSANERKDLIEDLNEEGFSDGHRPTEDDLPLIINRIRLIQEIGADAMDQANAEAFQEAYKDLVNLFLRLTRQ